MSSLEALRAAIEQVRHVTPAKRLAFFSRLAPIKVGDINSLTLDEALAFLRSLNIVTASTLSVTTARQMVRQHLGSLVKGLYQAEESSIQSSSPTKTPSRSRSRSPAPRSRQMSSSISTPSDVPSETTPLLTSPAASSSSSTSLSSHHEKSHHGQHLHHEFLSEDKKAAKAQLRVGVVSTLLQITFASFAIVWSSDIDKDGNGEKDFVALALSYQLSFSIPIFYYSLVAYSKCGYKISKMWENFALCAYTWGFYITVNALALMILSSHGLGWMSGFLVTVWILDCTYSYCDCDAEKWSESVVYERKIKTSMLILFNTTSFFVYAVDQNHFENDHPAIYWGLLIMYASVAAWFSRKLFVGLKPKKKSSVPILENTVPVSSQ